MAMLSKATLSTIATTVPTVGHRRVKPSVYLRPIAHPISRSPAVTRISQFIKDFLSKDGPWPPHGMAFVADSAKLRPAGQADGDRLGGTGEAMIRVRV